MVDLESLLAALVRHGVEFVVVGGFAAWAHGASLTTQDLDVCCDFSRPNLLRLHRALEGLHPVHRMTPVRPPLRLDVESCPPWKNLYLETDLGQLDCLSEITGVGPFEAVRNRSVLIHLPFGVCRVLGLDALIEAKEAMGRPQDRQAVLQLRAIMERVCRPDGPPGHPAS